MVHPSATGGPGKVIATPPVFPGSDDSSWAERLLLRGPSEEDCLAVPDPMSRGTLRRLVAERGLALRNNGVTTDSAVLVRLPACVEFVTTVLAAWSLDAQVVVVDHRVPGAAVRGIADTFTPAVIVSTDGDLRAGTSLPARRQSDHALVQISSGSTGLPKAVGRGIAEIEAEVRKTSQMGHLPRAGDTAVLLASFAHMYGFFAGMMHCLNTGAVLRTPRRMSPQAILTAAHAAPGRATLLGVPFHLDLLTALPPRDRPLPAVERFVCSGDVLSPSLRESFTRLYGAPVGQLYGMTETGLIAASPDSSVGRGVGRLVPGVIGKFEDGELCVALDSDPYLFRPDLRNWQDGWFHTGDAAEIDDEGWVTLHGRTDAQIAIGGLKVNLLEVEQVVRATAGVSDAVVVFDKDIIAYVQMTYLTSTRESHAGRVLADLATRLAPHQRPRRCLVVDELPKTPSGKKVRDAARLALSAKTGGAA
ncbi:class I adenylate-forming enzyme family protein [Lentzea sp. NPDC059081]|uniref:class I adenylate-forming enzyme family protein n=1 Tax=Lentzea sp. NPDC059081 TaxID=3346719 RepID=UPI0036B94465